MNYVINQTGRNLSMNYLLRCRYWFDKRTASVDCSNSRVYPLPVNWGNACLGVKLMYPDRKLLLLLRFLHFFVLHNPYPASIHNLSMNYLLRCRYWFDKRTASAGYSNSRVYPLPVNWGNACLGAKLMYPDRKLLLLWCFLHFFVLYNPYPTSIRNLSVN